MITAAKRFGLYSAFRACSVICLRFSVHPRFTVATMFLVSCHPARNRSESAESRTGGPRARTRRPLLGERAGGARRRGLHRGRRGSLNGRRDAIGIGEHICLRRFQALCIERRPRLALDGGHDRFGVRLLHCERSRLLPANKSNKSSLRNWEFGCRVSFTKLCRTCVQKPRTHTGSIFF